MRKILYVFILTLFVSSCIGNRKYRTGLSVADSMASVNPHRAMFMLDSMRSEMETAPEHERMYYKLLCIKAADKAYVRHTSDRIILSLVDYYENGGDDRLLPEVYYYAGSVYRDMNDAPRALDFYQKAAAENNVSIKLKANLYSQMGHIYMNQYLYTHALDMFYKAYECDKTYNDTVNVIYVLRDLAYNYNKIGNVDSCIYFYEKAYRQAERINDDDKKIEILQQMASFYIGFGNYIKAKEYLQPALDRKDPLERSPVYCMVLKICMGTGQYDSAHFYATKLLNLGTIHAKQTASGYLMKLSLIKNDNISAQKYYNLFTQYTDSVNRLTAIEAVSKMNSLYNYNLREKENMELRAENSSRMSLIVFIFSICCILASLFIVYVYRNRQRQKVQLERLKRIKKDLFEQSEEFIHCNNQKIKQLELELHKITDENVALTTQLTARRDTLLFANETATRKLERNKAVRSNIVRTDVYRRMQDLISRKNMLSDVDWDELDNLVNAEIVDFRSSLYSYYNISMHEYHICLLIRLGLQPVEMSILLGRSISAVSKARKRLQEKFFSNNGTAKDFDDFINSL